MGFISDVYRTARKEHSCNLCGKKIKKGDEYRLSFYSDGGDVYSLREHKSCIDLVSELDAAYLMEAGEYSQDDFDEAITELGRKEVCPKCPYWDEECQECREDNYVADECMDKVLEFGRTHRYDARGRRWVEREAVSNQAESKTT